MMHERLEMVRNEKPPEFGTAAVAHHKGFHPAVNEPVDQREKRQAQAVGFGNEANSDEHNQTSQAAIKIFLHPKLAPAAKRTSFEKFGEGGDGPPCLMADRAVYGLAFVGDFHLRRFFALAALAHNGFHKRIIRAGRI